MRERIAFQTNVPVSVALAYPGESQPVITAKTSKSNT
jgi:hypothetical protein